MGECDDTLLAVTISGLQTSMRMCSSIVKQACHSAQAFRYNVLLLMRQSPYVILGSVRCLSSP